MSDLEITIQMLRHDIDGDVCSRSRVTDALLDLRLDAVERHDVVGIVDHALAALPGKNMVPAAWWRDRLDELEIAAINPVEAVG